MHMCVFIYNHIIYIFLSLSIYTYIYIYIYIYILGCSGSCPSLAARGHEDDVWPRRAGLVISVVRLRATFCAHRGYICMYTYVIICIYIHVHLCVYVCMYACMHASVYVYIYIYV